MATVSSPIIDASVDDLRAMHDQLIEDRVKLADANASAGKCAAATRRVHEVEYALVVEGADFVPWAPAGTEPQYTDEQLVERMKKVRAVLERDVPPLFIKRGNVELKKLSTLARERGLVSDS